MVYCEVAQRLEHKGKTGGSVVRIHFSLQKLKQQLMKKIVIYRDEIVNNKNVRTVLRAIRPMETSVCYGKNNQVNDREVKELAKYLEPTSNGYYMA